MLIESKNVECIESECESEELCAPCEDMSISINDLWQDENVHIACGSNNNGDQKCNEVQ